jgi:hypothetical protein
MFRVSFIGAFVLAFAASSALGEQGTATNITRQGAEALMSECETERQKNITPLKEEAIDDCINKQGKDKAHCDRFYRNFGERTVGGTRRGLFWELPVCQRAVEAQKYFRMNPGANTYSFR